jgi:Uncharacterised nucleotidyltransferase
MSQDIARTVQALLWASGLAVDETSLYDADQDLFLDALIRHKIAGRFLNRVDGDPDVRIPEDLTERVREIYQEAVSRADRLDRDAAWLAENIVRHPKWDGRPLVLLKGNAASHYLSVPRARRSSSDLDLLISEPERYQSIIEEFEYSESWLNFCHEQAVLGHRERSWVDLHEYFPIWRYPKVPYQTVASGYDLRMTDWVGGGRLEYETVLEASRVHPGVGMPEVRVPDATMTAFIMCLHIFHDYVAPALVQSLAKVRLIELCELADLAGGADFAVDRFAHLVTSHQASDAVALSQRLLRTLGFSMGGLAKVDVAEPAAYPQEIGFGLLIDAQTPIPDLLIRSDSFGRIFDLISPTDIVLSPGTDISTRNARRQPDGGLPAVFHSTPTAHPDNDFDFDCSIRESDGLIVFDMTAFGPPGAFFDEFVLFFGNEIVHAAYDVYREGFRNPLPESGCDATWDIKDESWRVVVRVPRTVLTRHRGADGRVRAVLQAGRFLEPLNNSWTDFYRRSVSSACLPLHIHLTDAG